MNWHHMLVESIDGAALVLSVSRAFHCGSAHVVLLHDSIARMNGVIDFNNIVFLMSLLINVASCVRNVCGD